MEVYTVPKLKCFGRIEHLTLSNHYTQVPDEWDKKSSGHDWLTDLTGLPAHDHNP